MYVYVFTYTLRVSIFNTRNTPNMHVKHIPTCKMCADIVNESKYPTQKIESRRIFKNLVVTHVHVFVQTVLLRPNTTAWSLQIVMIRYTSVCCSVLQWVAAYSSVLQCVVMCCCVCCSVLQYVMTVWSLQTVTVCYNSMCCSGCRSVCCSLCCSVL